MAWTFLANWRKRGSARRELFVHEDDWGQIEVLPSACAAWCEDEFSRIAAFSAAHREPHGYGWTDVYRHPQPPRTLADIRMPFDDATRALAQLLPSFDRVVSGTFSSPRPVARVRGFGPELNAGIVLSPDKAGAFVETVNLILNGTEDACASVTRTASALPAPEPIILVNWQSGSVLRL